MSRGNRCFGFEWRPDLDAELLDDGGVQADLSTCMLDGDTVCGAADSGRQETLIVKAPPEGTSDYTLNVFMGTNDRTEGQFRYEISTGPLEVGTLIDSPVTIDPDNPNPNNNAPVANDQAVETDEDTSVAITLTASDDDLDPLTYVVVSGPSNGSLSGAAPDLTYTPNPDFNGSDSFTFKANDGFEDGNVATVSITVAPVNDAPVANGDSVTTQEGTAVAITLTASDVDSGALTYSVVSGPSNGSLSGTAPDLTYTPNGGYIGSDSFTFKANDGLEDSNIATVSVDVLAASLDPQVASCSPSSANAGARLTVTVAGLNFQSGATVDFGSRIAIQSVTFVNSSELAVGIKIHRRASGGSRDVTVSNPDGNSATGLGCFSVN